MSVIKGTISKRDGEEIPIYAEIKVDEHGALAGIDVRDEKGTLLSSVGRESVKLCFTFKIKTSKTTAHSDADRDKTEGGECYCYYTDSQGTHMLEYQCGQRPPFQCR